MPVSARSFAVFMAALAVIGLLGFGLLTKSDDALALGDEFPTDDLERLNGEGSASVADYRGQWVLVNVWASWCDPCRDEAPALQRFHRQHREQGFTVLGVDSQDISDDARAFVAEFGLTYPQLHESGDDYARDELNTTGVPESFLVDPDGELALHRPGPVTEEYLQTEVAPLIEGER